MRGIVLFAVSQCIALTAFCQLPAIATADAQKESGNPSTLNQPLFSLESGQIPQSAPVQTQPCSGLAANRGDAAKPDPSWHFQAPCLDPRVFALNAQNGMQAPPLPGGRWPHARSIPIPTQWPDAKFEPIPTDWPNLKMLPIAERTRNPHPAK